MWEASRGKPCSLHVALPGGNHSCSRFTLREQVRHNFQSVTSQSYRPLEVPDGKYPLPWHMHQTSSGYSREKPSAATPTKEVSAGLGGTPRREGEPKAGV